MKIYSYSPIVPRHSHFCSPANTHKITNILASESHFKVTSSMHIHLRVYNIYKLDFHNRKSNPSNSVHRNMLVYTLPIITCNVFISIHRVQSPFTSIVRIGQTQPKLESLSCSLPLSPSVLPGL